MFIFNPAFNDTEKMDNGAFSLYDPCIDLVSDVVLRVRQDLEEAEVGDARHLLAEHQLDIFSS